MPKSYFQFKQFIIHQDQCAMKVCTDACILGAYAEQENAQRILDIGAGTGLLSLMLAQRTEAKIDAVEIDEAAYKQANRNITESKFAHKVWLQHQSIQNFSQQNQDSDRARYDLIISNPPFYQNSLQSPDEPTSKALHATTLTLEELTDAVIQLLKPDGRFIVLLPPFEARQLAEVAQKKALYLSKRLLIQHNPQKQVFRHIMTFGKTPEAAYAEETLVIHEKETGAYSEKFRNLLSDYYTIF
ncbi:tRNA1(Val) (adenine(37)-N6)-methyltransferase [Emticicia fluvialis]|uniref:tRNA1(Val) (adenine(37)-N6)-methyltransferase n=1 Tax=Emticicia fluvialis TaxID=2974474 RepID=UPI002165C4FB|nr:methyltransferase [Emticicia fluvialis]